MSGVNVRLPVQDMEKTAAVLLETVAGLVRETGSRRAAERVGLDSDIERDLGLDSLGRTELLLRLERVFELSLPEEALLAATPRELLREVLTASGRGEAAVPELRYRQPETVGELPSAAETLSEVLEWHVRKHPERTCIYLYGEGDQVQEALSYLDLWRGALKVASGLRDRDLRPGARVAIMLPTEAGYFFSFFGILLAGGVPVPIYPPVRPSQIEEHLRRHGRILSNAQAAMLITIAKVKTVASLLQARVEGLAQVLTLDDLTSAGVRERWRRPVLSGQDIAFLQYTSGSTGDPKGVTLSHANLLANLRAMGERIQVSSADVFISWLPLYHDMGLIGACLGALYYAYPLVVMSPLSFLKRPANWLWAIHRHRGTLSAAPNFAYELCLRNIDDRAIQGLDLSSWRMAFNGAEPVSPATLEGFIGRFARFGFRPEAMAPVYGLAESSLGLALQPPNRGVVIDTIDREIFMKSGRAVPVTGEGSHPLPLVSCGQPLAGHQVRIVDERGRELPDRTEGRLEFCGPSCTSGYFRNPEATRRLFDGDWLDSGDRAYLANGDVFLSGRVKDVIIRGGRNIYPYELEEAVGGIAGIRKGCVAVFAAPDPASATERLVVVAETRETEPQAREALCRRIQDCSIDLLGVPVDEVVLTSPHTVLKTSSGKIRRSAVCELYRNGTLGRRSQALWWQLTRLALSSLLPWSRRWLRHAEASLYAGYAWAVFAMLAPVVWLTLIVLPVSRWRWQLVHGSARLLAWLTGTGLRVQGLENLPDGPCVLVANHASYLDAFVLAATLARNFSYVAKRELADNPLIRWALARLDTLFVERFDLLRSAEEGQRVVQAAAAGRSLAFFPEGTFDRMPGLLPFRMGAFVAAARTGLPVVPVAIRGTRSILRAQTWFPRRGAIQVVIARPIVPQGKDWASALKLRDGARKAILTYSGEPDLMSENSIS